MTTLSILPRLSRPHLTSEAFSNHLFLLQTRKKHSQSRKQHTVTAATSDHPTIPIGHDHVSTTEPTPPPPLSLLPLPVLLRSWAITSISSYPLLLNPALKLMSLIAHSSSPFLNPDRNPLLHFLLKKTFYAQFCAGETPHEVQSTASRLKTMGFKGVILAYGKEIVVDKSSKASLLSHPPTTHPSPSEQAATARDIATWRHGTVATVAMTSPSDYVALKFSGAGPTTMRHLAHSLPPPPALQAALTEICDLARSKNVALLFDAEQSAIQPGIDAWTLAHQRRYNTSGTAVVYGTYQAYLKSTPDTLSHHLSVAQAEEFTLGVKLVRGAYMASDPREIFWDSKEETDAAYDGLTHALVSRAWTAPLTPPSPAPSNPSSTAAFPSVNLVLATHNRPSVHLCMSHRRARTLASPAPLPNISMVYAQLMGMADDVGCELVLAGGRKELVERDERVGSNAYKYLVWGSVGECVKYLVRRAEENRGGLGRGVVERRGLGGEVWRRVRGGPGSWRR